MNIGAAFYSACVVFYERPRATNHIDARVAAYKALIDRHGFDRVLRHTRGIGRILTTIETRARDKQEGEH